MSNLNRLKVVDFTAGRLSSDDINTDIPFTDNFDKTRTIQQANAVIGAYVNRNYKDMQNKANIDDIPTKTSQLENDSGYITSANIPTKTSELENDSGFITSASVPTKTSDLDNDSGFITKDVNNLTYYTKSSDLNDELNDINTDITHINEAIDLQLPNRIGDIVVDSIRSKNMVSGFGFGAYNTSTGVFDPTNTSVYATQKIPTKQGQKYCISGFNTGSVIRMFYWNNDTFISTEVLSVSSDTLVITSSGNYIAFQTSTSTVFNNLQLEKGETKTPFKPFQNLDNTQYILYDNPSGSNSDITLSESVDNYKFIEIYFRQQDNTYSYTKVANPNGKTVILMGYHVTNNGGAVGISAKNVSISGTSITTALTNRYMCSNIVQNNTLTGGSQTNNIFITKVVGYK